MSSKFVIGTFLALQLTVAGPLAVHAQPVALPGNPLTLYDNGPLVNAPGNGAGGKDASLLQTSLGMRTLGFSAQSSMNNRVADEFTVPEPGWVGIEAIKFYAYQTGSPAISTIDQLYAQIWDGTPASSQSKVVWGDMLTNIHDRSDFAGIYRATNSDPTDITRPIMEIVASVNIPLDPGTYWIEWKMGGYLESGPYVPTVTANGLKTTGNAIQYLAGRGTWEELIDHGTNTRQGLPFILEGYGTPVVMGAVIKANGADGPVNIAPGDILSLEVELKPGYLAYNPADWWLLVKTPFPPPLDWFHFVKGSGWISGLDTTYQGPCMSLKPKEVLRMKLPPGKYNFYFGVDMNMNGQLDLDELYYDKTEVTVE